MSQRILIKYKINCHSAQVKTLGVMVNVIGTPCFDTVSVYLLLEEMKFKLLLKIGKTGCRLISITNLMHKSFIL